MELWQHASDVKLMWVAGTHLPHAVGEQEAEVVPHLPDKGQCLLVVVLGLTTEARNEVAAETHSCRTPGTSEEES